MPARSGTSVNFNYRDACYYFMPPAHEGPDHGLGFLRGLWRTNQLAIH